MKFKNDKGDELEVNAVGWEFPNEDWLMIVVKGKDANGVWEGVDPSLTISEARALANWLVSEKSLPESTIDFLEPEIEFRFVGGLLRVYLEFRYRPPWSPSDFDDKNNEYYIEFNLSRDDLGGASDSFIQEIENVPRPM